MKKNVLKRIPPGDRWAEITGNKKITEYDDTNIIGETLTDALSYVYKKYDIRIFEVNANIGIISIDDGKIEPKKIKKYSLYGE
ncbi:MAG: hypothetical protein H8E13_20115 [Actinobacteria bacterium]|nr:hypothetical protein [Actinomycetota bacterium]